MTVNHPQWGTMCEICFTGLTPETCAVDRDGQLWDVCAGGCAREAGIVEGPRSAAPATLGGVEAVRGAREATTE